ncbi:MAG: 3-dehydroquinate synthase [Candidatus Micrarchaeota archaeon]
MRRVRVSGAGGDCEIAVGESISSLEEYCRGARTVIVTDANVKKHQGAKFPDCEVLEVGTGEGAKKLSTVESLYRKFLDIELDKSCMVVGIGGGVVSDITGFAASTYLRGVPFGFVPTTLLAQVDASIGGKNGVNLEGYKNIIGTIRQPRFVLCDPGTLSTLPERELRCGFAEVVKHAAIADAGLFSYLEKNAGRALSLEPEAMLRVLEDSVAVKAKIVSVDEEEKGERMKLNFGHTIGHAIEKTAGMPHGEAVAAGMVAESEIAVRMGLMERNHSERLSALLLSLGLPAAVKAPREGIADAIRKDKKRRSEKVLMPVLNGIGSCRIAEVELKKLEGALDAVC